MPTPASMRKSRIFVDGDDALPGGDHGAGGFGELFDARGMSGRRKEAEL